MHVRKLSAVLLLSFFSLAGASIEAQEKKTEPEKKPERPSQDAVLAKNTVLLANQSFGKDEKQSLDVYAPKGAKGAAIVIFIHGGEWTKGDKSAVSFKPKFFNENGIVFVSTNYRLSPAVKHPAHVSDVAAAIRWVREHAKEFGGDGNKIVLMGHSAGCHLATLTTLDPKHLEREKLQPKDLCGVVAWSGGMYNLVDRAKGDGFYPKYIRQAFGESEAEWRDASPMAHVGDAAMPSFLFVSIEKGNASHKAAEAMVDLIKQKKGQAESVLIEGRDHFMANHLIGAPDDKTGQLIVNFVTKVTAGK
jgi:acetyl esterase/lipase